MNSKKLLTLIFFSLLPCINTVAEPRSAEEITQPVDEPTLGKSTKANRDLAEAHIDEEPTLRYTEQKQGLGIHGGIVPIGYRVMGEWSYHFLTDLQMKIWLGGEFKNKETLSSKSIIFQPSVAYTTFTNDTNFYLNLLLGPILIYGKYKDEKLPEKDDWKFNVGLNLAGEIEFFLTSNLTIVLDGGPTFYFLKDDYGRWDAFLTAGLKFHF
jgi:hypothetical protein